MRHYLFFVSSRKPNAKWNFYSNRSADDPSLSCRTPIKRATNLSYVHDWPRYSRPTTSGPWSYTPSHPMFFRIQQELKSIRKLSSAEFARTRSVVYVICTYVHTYVYTRVCFIIGSGEISIMTLNGFLRCSSCF